MNTLLAAVTPIFGEVKPVISGYPTGPEGLIQFATNLLRIILLVAGIFAFINFILAGYSFLTAGGDPKNVSNAWQKIWLSIVGLVIIVGSFVIAGIVGFLLFGDPLFILRPKIYGPGT